jgi:hypothetical protein
LRNVLVGKEYEVFGYQLKVDIVLEPFDIKTSTIGDVPPELLRCIGATYNSLIEEFGR